MIPTLEQVQQLTAILPNLADDRPEWLRNMASASDDTAMYYRFFHQLVKRHHPLRVLEIGTYVGTSAAHLGFANTDGGTVLTVDINPDAKLQLERAIEGKGLHGVSAVTKDSMQWANENRGLHGQFDILFIDGLHNFNQTYGEYAAYRPFLKEGGLIFFDDLELDMATREMQVFWALVPEQKMKLDSLHYTGFGVCMKESNVFVPAWGDIVGRAEQMQREFAASGR